MGKDLEMGAPLQLGAWQARLGRSQKRPRTNGSRNEILIVLHGVFSVPAGPTSLAHLAERTYFTAGATWSSARSIAHT